MTKTKKLFIILIIGVLFLSSFSFAFAQEEEEGPMPTEVDYPDIPGAIEPETIESPVTRYAQYVFNFAIFSAALIALLVLIYAGFQYFISAGNPEKLKEAKDRILAALIGLLILFGSYLILWTINPNLIVFNLPRLQPIISTLPAGVLACKEEPETTGGRDAVLRAWDLVIDYYFRDPSRDEQKEIQRELDLLLERISQKCFTVLTSGDLREDFDNKIEVIYLIPNLRPRTARERILTYGVIIYEEKNYEGISKPFYRHLRPGAASFNILKLEKRNDYSDIKISSIKPFRLIPYPDPNWEVVLYQETNRNTGFSINPLQPFKCNVDALGQVDWYCPLDPRGFGFHPNEFVIRPYSPKSIEVKGNLLAILIMGPAEPYADNNDNGQRDSGEPYADLNNNDRWDADSGVIRSDTFFNEIDGNLENNSNIVVWVNCNDYESDIDRQCERFVGGGMVGIGATYRYQCCAQAASNGLIIISAKIY